MLLTTFAIELLIKLVNIIKGRASRLHSKLRKIRHIFALTVDIQNFFY